MPPTTGFEHLLEAMPDALVGVDPKGLIRFVNRQTESLFGYDRAQLIGQPVDTLVPENLGQIFAELRSNYLAEPSTRPLGLQVELTGRHQDGTEFPINISLSHTDTGDVLLVITAGGVVKHRQAVESARLTNAIVGCPGDAIISMTLEGIITSWNPAAEGMYGRSGKEVIGRHGSCLLPEDRADELSTVLAGVKDGQVIEDPLYFAHPRKDGTLVTMSITISPIRNESGEVIGLASIHHDISAHGQAFEAAQRMAAIVEGSDDAIISETLEGIITSWNPAAARMFGYSSEEIVGKSVGLLIPEDQAGDAKAVVAKVSAGQHVEHLKTFNVRKDGTVFPISLTVSPVRGVDGSIVGASVICRDKTEQVKTETALAQASHQYQMLAESASDLVVLASPDHVITWVSPSVTNTLGWEVEDLMGTRLVDLVHPDDAAATAGPREAVYSGHKPATPPGGFVMRMRTKSGQYRRMAGKANPVKDEAGAVVGVVAGLRDVEDLVRAREEAEAGRAALRATADSLLDPHVLLEAVRDEAGQIVDFVYVDANPAACAYNGISYEDLVGARLLDLQPGNVGSGLLDKCRHVVETGEPLMQDDMVYAQELMGGQERRYDMSAARVGDGLSYTWRDVTDRHEAARWLAESEEHYRLLAENASDVVMRLSPDRSFEWVSGSIADVLGWTATDLLGQVIDEFIHPEELPLFLEAVASTSPATVANSEFRFRRSDGSYRWVLCHARLKTDEKGLPVALVGGLVDINARKEVEAHEQDRLETLERFQRLTVGRELKMIELKREIESLRSLAHKDGDGSADKS